MPELMQDYLAECARWGLTPSAEAGEVYMEDLVQYARSLTSSGASFGGYIGPPDDEAWDVLHASIEYTDVAGAGAGTAVAVIYLAPLRKEDRALTDVTALTSQTHRTGNSPIAHNAALASGGILILNTARKLVLGPGDRLRFLIASAAATDTAECHLIVRRRKLR